MKKKRSSWTKDKEEREEMEREEVGKKMAWRKGMRRVLGKKKR